MVRGENGQNLGFFAVFVMEHFKEIDIAALPMGLKPSHVEKFRECRLTDVRESELKESKHVQNIRSHSQNRRSKNHDRNPV